MKKTKHHQQLLDHCHRYVVYKMNNYGLLHRYAAIKRWQTIKCPK